MKVDNSVSTQMTNESNKEEKIKTSYKYYKNNQNNIGSSTAVLAIYVGHVAPTSYRYSKKLQESFH